VIYGIILYIVDAQAIHHISTADATPAPEGARCTACTWGNDYDSDLTVSDDDLDTTLAAGTYKWFCEVHILLSYTSKLNHRKNPSRINARRVAGIAMLALLLCDFMSPLLPGCRDENLWCEHGGQTSHSQPHKLVLKNWSA
jgi:hypothetical protein